MIVDRLDPRVISHELVRAQLYRDIRGGDLEWPVYTIRDDEVHLPELIAARHYGSDNLKWVVMIAAGLDDMGVKMTPGEDIQLPPQAWVRSRIKSYVDMEAKSFGGY